MLYKFLLFKRKLEMFVKSNSTGKSKSKQTQSVRLTECSTCPKLIQTSSNRKDYERPQPIKIAQLLRGTENLKKSQKDSVRKKIQPERLGPLSNVKSVTTNQKQDGMGIHDQPVRSKKCVRRNLNFNETLEILKNNSEKSKSIKFMVDESFCKDVYKPMGRKSLLLPPNTIKHRHLQKYTIESSKYSKIPQFAKEVVSTDTKHDTNSTIQKEHKEVELNNESPIKENLLESECIKTSNKCATDEAFNHTSTHVIDANHAQCSDIPCVITKSLISSECVTYQNDNSVQNKSLHKETFILDETNSKSKVSVKLKDQDRFIETLCNNLQDTRLIESENKTNVRYSPSKAIYVDRNQIIHLESDLKALLAATEENVSKIKSTLTCVTRLLSINNEKSMGKEEHSELGKVRHTMLDKEVQVETCTLTQQPEESLKTSTSHCSQIIVTDTKYIDTSKLLQNDENNKENHKTMNIQNISDVIEDRFLQLENQHNIAQIKSVQDHCIQQNTPTITKYEQKRSLREYMALKSSMSFLETPDGKKFRSLCPTENVGTSIVNKTYISNKVLTDLHNLYSESPELN